jgi:hypothetical protein
MADVPIHFGHLESSLKAVMVFPREPDKARTYAAWLITRDISTTLDKGGGLLCAGLDATSARLELLDVTAAASDFAFLYREAIENFTVSLRAGITIASLWGLICEHRTGARWEAAIEVAERYHARAPKLPASRPVLRKSLSSFAPVLHLLGTRTILERTPRDPDSVIEFTSAPKVDYLREDDVRVFAGEARKLQVALLFWDQARPHRSEYLREMLDLRGPWTPPPMKPDWPPMPQIRPLLVDPNHKPKLRKRGRPRKIQEK